VRDPWTWIRAIFKYRSVDLDVIEGWRAALAAKAPESIRVPAVMAPIRLYTPGGRRSAARFLGAASS
jgi:hypothetical protein